MSTRCQIGLYETKDANIKDFGALLYKHCDGYPDGTLPLIEKFCKDFNKVRGLSDIEYAAAWLMYELINEAVQYNKEASKKYDNVPKNGRDYLGYGVCGDKQIHGDIEFYYAIYPDRIQVFQVGYNQTKADMDRWHCITTIPL